MMTNAFSMRICLAKCLTHNISTMMREQWFQRTTYRKLHMRSPMVTWLMTLCDPKRSRSWPQYLWSVISQKLCEKDSWLKLSTILWWIKMNIISNYRYISQNLWSRDQSCHLSQFCSWQYRSIFIRLAVVASQICEITRNCEKIRT